MYPHEIYGRRLTERIQAFRFTENCVGVDLLTNEQMCGELNLPQERIEASARILADILLDFAKNGGDMNNLTPENVFGTRRPQ